MSKGIIVTYASFYYNMFNNRTGESSITTIKKRIKIFIIAILSAQPLNCQH